MTAPEKKSDKLASKEYLGENYGHKKESRTLQRRLFNLQRNNRANQADRRFFA
jgi:hypothetical protein